MGRGGRRISGRRAVSRPAGPSRTRAGPSPAPRRRRIRGSCPAPAWTPSSRRTPRHLLTPDSVTGFPPPNTGAREGLPFDPDRRTPEGHPFSLVFDASGLRAPGPAGDDPSTLGSESPGRPCLPWSGSRWGGSLWFPKIGPRGGRPKLTVTRRYGRGKSL